MFKLVQGKCELTEVQARADAEFILIIINSLSHMRMSKPTWQFITGKQIQFALDCRNRKRIEVANGNDSTGEGRES